MQTDLMRDWETCNFPSLWSLLFFASLFSICWPFFPAFLCSWLNVASQQLLSVHMSRSPKHRERVIHLVSILNSWEKEPERHSLHQMTNLDFPKISSNSRALCGVYCTYLAWFYIVTFYIMGLFSKYIVFSWLHCVCQSVTPLVGSWDPYRSAGDKLCGE